MPSQIKRHDMKCFSFKPQFLKTPTQSRCPNEIHSRKLKFGKKGRTNLNICNGIRSGGWYYVAMAAVTTEKIVGEKRISILYITCVVGRNMIAL